MTPRLLITASLLAVTLSAQTAPSFILALSANGTGSTTLYPDEPLLLDTMLLLDEGGQASIAMLENQPWTAGLTVSISDSEGKEVPVTWKGFGPPPSSFDFFSPANSISAVSGIDAATIGTLPAGVYRLNATFDNRSLAAPGSWSGIVRAMTMTLTVSAIPRPDGNKQQVFKQRLLAQWELRNDKPETALAFLNRALEVVPDDIVTLSEKASVLTAMDRRDEAVAMLERAIMLFGQRHPDSPHPPRELLSQLRRLRPL